MLRSLWERLQPRCLEAVKPAEHFEERPWEWVDPMILEEIKGGRAQAIEAIPPGIHY